MSKNLLVGLLLAAGAAALVYFAMYTPQPHPDYGTVKAAVDNRITYKSYAKRDYRYIGPSERAEGNCAVFAQTYAQELILRGHAPKVEECWVNGTEYHAYVAVGGTMFHEGWALDNRHRVVVRRQDVGCTERAQ